MDSEIQIASIEEQSSDKIKRQREPLSDEEREKIRTSIIQGFPLVNDLYLEESRWWYPLEEEVYLKSLID